MLTKAAGNAETTAWVVELIQYVDVETYTAFRLNSVRLETNI